jgi:hypothetical protein
VIPAQRGLSDLRLHSIFCVAALTPAPPPPVGGTWHLDFCMGVLSGKTEIVREMGVGGDKGCERDPLWF